MRKGIAAPTILLVVVLFSVAGIVAFSLGNNKETAVKGTSSKKPVDEKSGFVFEVNSSSTWEMLEYLCNSESECRSGPTSGKRWGTVGGGEASMKNILVPFEEEWQSYKFMKVYMKPSLSASGGLFKVNLFDAAVGAKKIAVGDDTQDYDAVLIPLASPISGQIKIASFQLHYL